MTGFEDRQKGFDAKIAHDSKMDFEMEAKISKAYGLWAAEQFGLDGADAQSYASSVVDANLEEPGFDDVLKKVKDDFFDRGIDISDKELTVNLERAIQQAQKSSISND